MAARDATRRWIRLLAATVLAGAALVAVIAPVASAAPSVTITEPVSGVLTNVSTPTFKGTAEPAAGPVTLRIYAGVPLESNLIRKLSVEPGSGSWTLGPVAALADGIYTATASQTNGETGTSVPVSFTIRTTAPVVTIEQPHPAPGEATPSFTGAASESTTVKFRSMQAKPKKGPLLSTAIAAGTGAGGARDRRARPCRSADIPRSPSSSAR